jgi:cell division protein FtsA
MEFEKTFRKVVVPETLVKGDGSELRPLEVPVQTKEKINTGARKGMTKFWEKFKNNLLELFKEEGDKDL